MKRKESNFLLYGLLTGVILGTGLIVYLSSRFISKAMQSKRERKHKFYEGIDDIFNDSALDSFKEEDKIDEETQLGIIEELFSRTK